MENSQCVIYVTHIFVSMTLERNKEKLQESCLLRIYRWNPNL